MNNHAKFLMGAALIALLPSSGNSETIADTGVDFLKKQEKCFAIVKAGKNDCASENHSCATYSKTSAAPQEWIMLPKGVCEKIVGASLVYEVEEVDD